MAITPATAASARPTSCGTTRRSSCLTPARVAKGDAGVGSTAALQARFSIGHPRTVRMMRQLEEFGIVGPNEGTKPRTVSLESPGDLERIADRIGRPAQTDLFAG